MIYLRFGAIIAFIAFAMSYTASPSAAFRGHVFEKSFGEAGTGDGQFSEPEGVAVNEASGNVYVVDQGNKRIEWFNSAGAYLGQFDGSGTNPNEEGRAAPEPLSYIPGGHAASITVDNACRVHELETHKTLSATQCEAFDPSNGDIYVPSGQYNAMAVDKFTATGAFITQIKLPLPPGAASSGEIEGVAVDSQGELWVADLFTGQQIVRDHVDNFSNNVVNEYRATRTIIESEGNVTVGFALDAANDLYARFGSFDQGVVDEFNIDGESINRHLDGEANVTTNGLAVELATSNLYIDSGASLVRLGVDGALAADGQPIENLTVPGGQGRGVGVDSTTGRIYVVEENGLVDVFELESPATPTISAESVSEITDSSATFQAEVNPRSEIDEPSTAYRFEYGTCASLASCHESPYEGRMPAPDGQLAAEYEPNSVRAHVEGLTSDAVYHYRLVAQNAFGVTEGEERIFTTQGTGSAFLPDEREWEMVSPPDKHGAGIQPLFALTPSTQAADSGDAMGYLTAGSIEAQPAGNSNFSQVISVRTPDGWISRDIALPHEEGTGLSTTLTEYRALSNDLSLALVQPFGAFDPVLSEEASEQTPYLRTDYSSGDPNTICTTTCYRPLVTSATGFENVPSGTEFAPGCPPAVLCGPEPLGATPDLSHVVFWSGVGLTGAPGDHGGLYEWSAGKLQLVSIRTNGEPDKAVDQLGLGQGFEDINQFRGPIVIRHAISDDGSRVYFTDPTLFVRENIGTPGARTIAVPGGSSPAAFQTASSDGSRVVVLNGGELSEFNVEDEVSTHLGYGVKGVIGASEDGSYVYFVSTDALSGEERNVEGAKAQGGQPNLYLAHAGAVIFIATLSAMDVPDWHSDGTDSPVNLTARVSPDGHWLAFMSQNSLTGYDNHDAVSRKLDEEVYSYHFSETGAGALACVSCDPTGALPHGVEYLQMEFSNSSGFAGGAGVWPASQWIAANVPAWASPYHQSRYLSDSGRLFFDSSDALVPQDINGIGDVYEYEPAGVGDCTISSPTYAPASSGCMDLISAGSSAEESGFLDASETGGDVFFATKQRLSAEDVDSSFDVYDAHECTSATPCLPPPEPPQPACEGDSCQPPVAAPTDLSPASLTFSGSGNVAPAGAGAVKPKVKALTRDEQLRKSLRVCTHKPRRQRRACERRARHLYGRVSYRRRAQKGGK